MQDLSIVREAVSEKRLLDVVKALSGYHRIQASPMYREAAQHAYRICKSYGLDVKLLSYEADPDVWYMQSKMFKEWSVSQATLDLAEPALRLADYSAEAMSVIQRSAPIDRREKPVDLVLLDKGSRREDYADLDLTDCFAFIRGHIRDYDWVYEKGALGVVTDYIMETPDRTRADLYRSLTYTSFWPIHIDGEPVRRGFVLSPEAGDALAARCRARLAENGGRLQVKPYIDAALENGHIEVVEVTLPGKDEKTVHLSAHLCHPKSSCNDDLSGVSAAIEAMNVLNRLIKEGRLAAPDHTVKLTLVPEYTGTFAYLSDHTDYANGLGGLNLDMVGGRQTRDYGPITLTKTPYQLPALNNELGMLAMEEAAREAGAFSGEPVALTNHCVGPHAGGSDHTVYSDPTVGIPCCMLGQWPDLNYHTATDTLDVIDPAVLKFSCLTAAFFAYRLATLQESDLPYLFAKQEELMVADKNRCAAEYLDGKIDKAMFGSVLYDLKAYYTACCGAAAKLVPGYDAAKDARHTAELFDGWIAYYGLSDDYPLDRGLNAVWQRTFAGPVQRFTDFRAKGFGAAVDALEAATQGLEPALHSVHERITYLIDGRRTEGEIVRKASLEFRRDMHAHVRALLDYYQAVGLIRPAES